MLNSEAKLPTLAGDHLPGEIMSQQEIGRNDPCPCGSGKKYKKCCIDKLIVPDELSRTKLGEYLKLFDRIAQYGAVLMREDKLRDILINSYEEFERSYKPGRQDGLHESFFMNWFFLDFRFGTYQKTIAERFLETGLYKEAIDQDRLMLTQLANSYATCYEVKEVQKEYILFEELETKKIWKMMTTKEPYQEAAQITDIWHMRLVGTLEEAWGFGGPYVFKKEARNDFEQIVGMHVDGFERYMKTRSLSFDLFRDACKASSMFWAEYLYRSSHPGREFKDPFRAAPSVKPQIVTTDKEKIRFCSVYFRITHSEGLNDRLNKIRSFEFNEQEQTWVWFKKRIKSAERIILGWVSIQGKYVVGKVNSLERALRLKDKLMKELRSFLVYEKIEGKDLDSMPPLSEEDKRKFEEEQSQMLANPEVRQFMQQKLEDYYLKEWIVTKIPALDNKTPLQTAQTEEGRLGLEVLINRMEMRGNSMPNQPEFDMNLLRKKLGLSYTNP